MGRQVTDYGWVGLGTSVRPFKVSDRFKLLRLFVYLFFSSIKTIIFQYIVKEMPLPKKLSKKKKFFSIPKHNIIILFKFLRVKFNRHRV